MIAKTAMWEGDRTIWRLDREADDEPVPQELLWIGGRLRVISPEIEAAWLCLSLAPFIHTRLLVPGPVTASLRGHLEAIFGIAILAGDSSSAVQRNADPFSATMIRDALDMVVSSLLRSPPQLALAVNSTGRAVCSAATEPQIATNAGRLRRSRHPLDALGELASIWMLCPTLSIGRLVSFLCQDEMTGIDPDRLIRVAGQLGIELHLPFADVSAGALGRIMIDLGMPPITVFRYLWHRYRTNAAIMANIYRDLQPRLADCGILDDSIRACEAIASRVNIAPISDTRSAERRAYFL